MIKKRVINSIYAVFLVAFSVNSGFYAQKANLHRTVQDLASMPLSNIQIEAQSIEGLLTHLSLAYDIPIGLELAIDDDELAVFTLDFKTGTLAGLLDQFTSEHSEYAWDIDSGIVHIFPKNQYRDPFIKTLLETKVSNFLIKEKTGSWEFEKSLLQTTEVKALLDSSGITRRGQNFSGGYIPQLGRNFSLSVSDSTVKTILNRVVKGSPVAKIWVTRKIKSEGSFILRLNARIEDYSLENRPVFPAKLPI